MSYFTGRDMAAAIRDALLADPCLAGLLDDEADVSHGTDAFCDESVNAHPGRAIRREQMGWPSDFSRAVITYGRFQAIPAFPASVHPWVENWSFVVSVFAREGITRSDGTDGGSGDLWALDIYEHVRRILGWVRGNDGLPCNGNFRVLSRRHDGEVQPLKFNDSHRYWQIATRFTWMTVSRGLIAPICLPCEAP